jgi:2-iminoacetate synthase
MSVDEPVPFRLRSEGPHALELTVERVGPDLLCRVHGGDVHVGSVALSEWREGRARTHCLSAEGHREGSIARHAAHGLCAAARCTVTCVAGIHFDGVSRTDIEAISADAYALARAACARLRDARIRSDLSSPGGLYGRIVERRADYDVEVDRCLATSIGELSSAVGAEESGREVRIFAPLYLSNACTNDCVYCGFRRSSEYERTHLSIDEAVAEAWTLHDRGIRCIDLVTGEIPSDPFVDYVCEATRAILERTGITRVHLNLGSLDEDQYRRLCDAGAAGYHLYQETYDADVYLDVHAAGGKREMASRLEAPHRAAEAGFTYVGLGVLLGLADLRTDLASLAAHAAILSEDCKRLEIGFSLPRVQAMEADPAYSPGRPVSDDDFTRAVAFLRLAHPGANLTLTTRERPEIRDRLLRYGIRRLSAGVSTAPGGYGKTQPGDATRAREQFQVADERSVEEVVAVVRDSGLSPVFE